MHSRNAPELSPKLSETLASSKGRNIKSAATIKKKYCVENGSRNKENRTRQTAKKKKTKREDSFYESFKNQRTLGRSIL